MPGGGLEGARKGSGEGGEQATRGASAVNPGLPRNRPDQGGYRSAYQALQGTFQPLRPFAGSRVSFLVEFFTTTTSPTSEPA